MTIELSTVPLPSENYQLEDMDGEMLLYHVSSTRTLHLNASAAIVWQLCDGQRSVGDIIDALKETYPDAGDQMGGDVTDAISELTNSGVLRS